MFIQNKKQRMMVRMAVLKGKDPQQILEEMEIIDKQGMLLFSVLVSTVFIIHT